MNLDHLRLFRDIAQTRSISRGAHQNGISQSAASQHLSEVEREVGITLLDRGTRPLTITEAGKLYLDMCRDVLRRREEFEAAVDQLRAHIEGTVRVASIYSVGLSELSQLEREFAHRFPQASLAIQYLRPEKVYEAVSSDRADLGLVSYPEATKEVDVMPWREEQMVVVLPRAHPLAAYATIEATDLEGIEFIAFDDDLPIRREIDRFLRDRHVQVEMALHFDNIQMIKEAVAHGAGVSILPERVAQSEVAQGRLAVVPLAAPALFRPVGIIHRRKKRFHGATRAFLDLLLEQPEPATRA